MFRLMVVVLAGLGIASAAGVAGAAEPGASPSSPTDRFSDHASLGLELGSGGVITQYRQQTGPSAVLFYGALRGTYDFSPRWAGELTLRQWFLPGSDHATMLGFGARFEPLTLAFGRVFVDGVLGVVSTSDAWAFGFDVGGGIEFDMPDIPGFAFGPYLRYGNVAAPADQTADGQAWSLGLSFTYHFGRAAAAAANVVPAPPRAADRPFRISVPDADRDGVPDDDDQCPKLAQGKYPDPFRPGCPENDEDNDGIPDVEDACPVTPVGPKPDPGRPGCPFIDSDGDGIPDGDDACPRQPGPASGDPTRNGCPTEKDKDKDKKARVTLPPEPTPPPPESTGPKPAHKPGMN